jgi:hypothetical protein
MRYKKNLMPLKAHLLEVFSWLPPETPLRQIAVFPSHPKDRHTIAGVQILSFDELMAEIRSKIIGWRHEEQRTI